MRPLEGLTVSLEQAVAAPFATRPLADPGARVIKVERPGSGDFARDYDQRVNLAGAGVMARVGTALGGVHYAAGSPQNPATENDLRLKVEGCLTGIPVHPHDITWAAAADIFRTHLTVRGD